MNFWKSSLNKFILLSTLMHLTLLGLALNLSAPKDHVRVLGITLGSATVTKLHMREDDKKAPPSTAKKVFLPTKMNNNSLKDVLSSRSDDTFLPPSSEQESVSTTEALDAKTTYFSLITQIIYRNKRYPRQAYSLQQEGLVVVKLKLNKDGEILDLSVLDESPYKSLNQASLDTISAIHRFPPIPSELGVSELTLRVPIEYKIRL